MQENFLHGDQCICILSGLIQAFALYFLLHTFLYIENPICKLSVLIRTEVEKLILER